MKLLPRNLWARLFALIAFGALMGILAGCSGGYGFDLAYTGGGLPPGGPDIGGTVVASSDEVATAQADPADGQVPVAGATVRLIRGRAVVGVAISGDEGYFRFDNPATGRYTLEIRPPVGSGLQRTQVEVQHQAGEQTYVEVCLQPARPGRDLPL